MIHKISPTRDAMLTQTMNVHVINRIMIIPRTESP